MAFISRAAASEEIPDVILRDLELAAVSPAFYALHFAGVELRAWQFRVCDLIEAALLGHRERGTEARLRVLARTCHGAGKTFLAALLAKWWVDTRRGSKALTLAPTWAQVNGLVWPAIRTLHRRTLERVRELYGVTMFGTVFDSAIYRIEPEWGAVGAASDRPENLEGHHSEFPMRVIDEAKAVPPEVFRATNGFLHGRSSLDLWITTPWTRDGVFYETDSAEDLGETIRAVVTVDELVAEGVAGSAAQRAAYLAEFPGWEARARGWAEYIEGDPAGFFSVADVDAAMSRENAGDGYRTLGIDIACSDGEDSDETVFAFAHGSAILRIEPMRTRDHVAVARLAILRAREFGADVIAFDSQGVGGPFGSILESEGWPKSRQSEFVASAAPSLRVEGGYRAKDRFTNWYAESADFFGRLLRSGALSLPKDAKLRSQILQVKSDARTGGKIEFQKRGNGGKSPDRFDACLVALCRGRQAGAAGVLAYMETARERSALRKAEVPKIAEGGGWKVRA